MMQVPAKRFLDIEMALRWAYRDEIPKRGRRGGAWAMIGYPSSSCMSEAASDHGASDGPIREPGFPAAAGDPHPDSLAIETAVGNLAAYAGCGFGDNEMTALTCGIPIDFDAVAIGVEALAAMAGTVTVHARMGTRPKWTAERPRPSWMTGPNGKPKVLIDEPIVFKRPMKDAFGRELVQIGTFPCPPVRKDVYRQGAYCPLKWRPDPRHLVAERAEYCAWHVALEILAATLAGRLAATAVLQPAAPWAPWRNAAERHGHPGVLAGLHRPSHQQMTREQAAMLRRPSQCRNQGGEVLRGARPVRGPPAPRKGSA